MENFSVPYLPQSVSTGTLLEDLNTRDPNKTLCGAIPDLPTTCLMCPSQAPTPRRGHEPKTTTKGVPISRPSHRRCYFTF